MPTTWTGGPRPAGRVYLLPTGLEIVTEGGARLSWPYAEVRQTQGAYAASRSGSSVAVSCRRRSWSRTSASSLLSTASPPSPRAAFRPRPAAASRPSRRRRRPGGGRHRGLSVPVGHPVRRDGRRGPGAGGVGGAAGPRGHGPARAADARCTDPAGVRQLDAIVARLAAATPDSPYTIRAFVVDRKQVNAFAARAATSCSSAA